MPRTARCACGQASITLDAEPQMHGLCHCTNCKRRTGSAFGISCYFPRASVTHQAGTMAIYAFHHRAQGHDQQRHFCTVCGTTLFWTISTMPALIGVAGGCFADDGLPEPTYSTAHGKKEPWLSLPPSWQVHEGW